MVKFDINELLENAKEDYEKAWEDSAALLEKTGTKFNLNPNNGKSHPIFDFIQEARDILVKLGFKEMLLPVFINEEEIFKEYGSEAALILDRVFYLAELPRPDIGLSRKKMDAIREMIPTFRKFDALKTILKEYKRGKLEADDFLEKMVERLNITQSQAAYIIDNVFPEFKALQPIPTKRTLRSHTTALWFPVIGALQGRTPLPLQLFHVGLKFRREQQLDATHLYESNTMSLVVSDEEITLEDCKTIARTICLEMGFDDAKFEMKAATGKYYAPGMEFEIFVKHEGNEEWLEIGDGGFYSPISCARFGIEQPVFNIGFGVERITMIKTGETDIRQLAYPYFYSNRTFSDKEISELISINRKPKTKDGKEVVKAILGFIDTHGGDPAPCDLDIGTFSINGIHVNISMWERESGVQLVSKAIKNEIIVKDGEIKCYDSMRGEIPDDAIGTGITFIEGIVNDFTWQLERLASSGRKEVTCRYKMVKKASDVNVKIDAAVMRFITDNQKRIKLNGPVFVNLTAIKQ